MSLETRKRTTTLGSQPPAQSKHLLVIAVCAWAVLSVSSAASRQTRHHHHNLRRHRDRGLISFDAAGGNEGDSTQENNALGEPPGDGDEEEYANEFLDGTLDGLVDGDVVDGEFGDGNQDDEKEITDQDFVEFIQEQQAYVAQLRQEGISNEQIDQEVQEESEFLKQLQANGSYSPQQIQDMITMFRSNYPFDNEIVASTKEDVQGLEKLSNEAMMEGEVENVTTIYDYVYYDSQEEEEGEEDGDGVVVDGEGTPVEEDEEEVWYESAPIEMTAGGIDGQGQVDGSVDGYVEDEDIQDAWAEFEEPPPTDGGAVEWNHVVDAAEQEYLQDEGFGMYEDEMEEFEQEMEQQGYTQGEVKEAEQHEAYIGTLEEQGVTSEQIQQELADEKVFVTALENQGLSQAEIAKAVQGFEEHYDFDGEGDGVVAYEGYGDVEEQVEGGGDAATGQMNGAYGGIPLAPGPAIVEETEGILDGSTDGDVDGGTLDGISGEEEMDGTGGFGGQATIEGVEGQDGSIDGQIDGIVHGNVAEQGGTSSNAMEEATEEFFSEVEEHIGIPGESDFSSSQQQQEVESFEIGTTGALAMPPGEEGVPPGEELPMPDAADDPDPLPEEEEEETLRPPPDEKTCSFEIAGADRDTYGVGSSCTLYPGSGCGEGAECKVLETYCTSCWCNDEKIAHGQPCD